MDPLRILWLGKTSEQALAISTEAQNALSKDKYKE